MLPMEKLSRRQQMTPEQRERERETQRRWYLNNIERVRKLKRESMKRKRAENPELARAKQKQWRLNNHETQKQKARDYHKRRFFYISQNHLRGVNRATYKELARLYKKQRGYCALTGRKLYKGSIHLDHIIPKSKGGVDELFNLRWVCEEANLAKRNLLDTDFFSLCLEVVRNNNLL
jgi:5-methylcytosine-specific restriction endonuclease McrA